MKTFVGLFLVAAFSMVSFAHADQACQDQIKQKQEELQKTEDRYSAGEATIIEVFDAKIALVDQTHACGLFVKNKFCKFKTDLMKAKISHLSGGDQDAAKKQLADFQTYCLDPKQ